MPSVRTLTRLIALLCIGGLLPSAAVAQSIVWTNFGQIQKRSVSGGPIETIIQFPDGQGASSITFDPVSAKFYYDFYSFPLPAVFERANVDGSQRETVPVPNPGQPSINIEARQLHWSNANSIYRSDLNGQSVSSHSYSVCCVGRIVAFADSLFFIAGAGLPKGIYRADPDGGNEELFVGTSQAFDLTHDPVDRKLYVAIGDGLFRLNYDGSNFENIASPSIHPTQVVIDRVGRKVYWTNRFSIVRSNLDGSNSEVFLSAADVGTDLDIQGLTIVESPAIPALSTTGLVVLSLSLVGGAWIIIKKRGSCSISGGWPIFGLIEGRP